MNTVILIEGPGGVGKSTVIELLLKHLVDTSPNCPLLFEFPMGKHQEGFKEELVRRTEECPEFVFYEMLMEQAKVLRKIGQMDDQVIVFDRAWMSSLVYQIGLQGRDMESAQKALRHLIGSAIPAGTYVRTFKLMCETPTLVSRKIARIAASDPEKLANPEFVSDLYRNSERVIDLYNAIGFTPHPESKNWSERDIWTTDLTLQQILNYILGYL